MTDVLDKQGKGVVICLCLNFCGGTHTFFFMENSCLNRNGAVGLGALGLGIPRKHSLV